MKYSGEWRFSEENTFHYGYLEYDRGTEIILEIFDDVILGLSEHRPGHSGITILGKLENGEKITLTNCGILSSQPYLDHFRITRIEAQFLFLGGHLQTGAEFDSSVVRYSNLNSFISYSSLIRDPLRTVNQSTKNFERLLEIPEFCKIRIFPRNGSLLFEIISLKGKSLDDYIELKSILQDFLNFVTSSEILIEKLYVVNQSESFRVEYHSQSPVHTKQNKRVLFKPYCKGIMFHYASISSNLETILTKWFEIAYKLKHVYYLFFAVVYHIDQYDVYRFLMITTALEVYHGLTMDEKSELKMKKQAHYQILCSEILLVDSLSNEVAKDLKERYDWAGELSFEERLTELYGLFPEIVSKYCHYKDIKNAIRSTVETRNYYTHYNPQKQDKALKDNDLFYITMDLQFLLQVCFLLELNFTKKEIDDIYLGTSS